jgi:hypothetical protein
MILVESAQEAGNGEAKNRRRISKLSVREVLTMAIAGVLGEGVEVEVGAIEDAVDMLPVVGEETTEVDVITRLSRMALLVRAHRLKHN